MPPEFPPLQKAQGRGTHCLDDASKVKSPGHPSRSMAAAATTQRSVLMVRHGVTVIVILFDLIT